MSRRRMDAVVGQAATHTGRTAAPLRSCTPERRTGGAPADWRGSTMVATSKVSLLDLSRIDSDDSFSVRGAGAAVRSSPTPTPTIERRRVAAAAVV